MPAELIPGTNNCTYGDVAIGPAGQVMNVCTLTESGQGSGSWSSMWIPTDSARGALAIESS